MTAVWLALRAVPGWVYGLVVVAVLALALWSSRATTQRQASEIAALRQAVASSQRTLADHETARRAETARMAAANATLQRELAALDLRRRQAEADLDAARRSIDADTAAIAQAASQGVDALAAQVNAAWVTP